MTVITPEVEEFIFKIIASSGDAKSSYMEAISCAKQGKYDEAEANMAHAKEAHGMAQAAHMDIMQKELSGESVVSMLLMHAEDQMMSVEVFELLCKEIIDLHKKLH